MGEKLGIIETGSVLVTPGQTGILSHNSTDLRKSTVSVPERPGPTAAAA